MTVTTAPSARTPLEHLTPLDQRVLAQLASGRARRLAAIVDGVYPASRWDSGPTEQTIIARNREVREILRGFEHLGIARQRRGGWWVKA
jgi:hypothetical protein